MALFNDTRYNVQWQMNDRGLDTVHFRIDATYLEDSIDNLRDYLKARFHAAVTERAADRRGSARIGADPQNWHLRA